MTHRLPMGSLLTITASVMYGIGGPVFSALLLADGWTTPTIILCAELLSMAFLAVCMRRKGIAFRVEKRPLLQLVTLGGTSYWAMGILLGSAYRYMLSGVASMIHFIYPIVVVVIMALLFRERITFSKVACIAVSMLGISLIVGGDGGGSEGNFAFGAALAAASGVAYAIYIVASDRSGFSQLNGLLTAFYIQATGAVLTSVYLAATKSLAFHLSVRNIFCAMAYPLTSMAAILCLSEGIRRIGAAKASIINMLEPAVALFASAIVFGGQDLTASTLLGCGCVLISVLVMAVEKNRSSAGP